MTHDEHLKFWLNSAEDDLESAIDVQKSGRYNWSLFIGHLALEKILKALYVQATVNSVPPKIHNLLKLAELSNTELSQEQQEFFAEVNRFHFAGRYPDFKEDFKKIATPEFTSEYLSKIKDYFKWLKSLFK